MYAGNHRNGCDGFHHLPGTFFHLCRLLSPPSPASVPVDARPIIGTITRFYMYPITLRLLQRRACWPAILHACTSSARTERSSAVLRRSASACSRHRYHAVATLATGRLPVSLQARSCDVRCLQRHWSIQYRRHNYKNFDAPWPRQAPICEHRRV